MVSLSTSSSEAASFALSFSSSARAFSSALLSVGWFSRSSILFFSLAISLSSSSIFARSSASRLFMAFISSFISSIISVSTTFSTIGAGGVFSLLPAAASARRRSASARAFSASSLARRSASLASLSCFSSSFSLSMSSCMALCRRATASSVASFTFRFLARSVRSSRVIVASSRGLWTTPCEGDETGVRFSSANCLMRLSCSRQAKMRTAVASAAFRRRSRASMASAESPAPFRPSSASRSLRSRSSARIFSASARAFAAARSASSCFILASCSAYFFCRASSISACFLIFSSSSGDGPFGAPPPIWSASSRMVLLRSSLQSTVPWGGWTISYMVRSSFPGPIFRMRPFSFISSLSPSMPAAPSCLWRS
mmetsp:Transcript_31713/g.94225  ORF Transcript_31713/g.94225 Transcript_31713/m.94225 type:complete len:370 (+) Transcript_31713:1083-2192(+)